MLEPAISVLREKTDSRYSLVIMAAKRARDLVDGKPPILPIDEGDRLGTPKPVSIAVDEIAKDLITYKRGEDIDLTDERVTRIVEQSNEEPADVPETEYAEADDQNQNNEEE